MPPAILKAQEAIGWVQHLCIIHPLWMGSMPRFVEGLFEQALRPGFAPVDIGPGWLDQAALSAERAHACDHGHAGVHLRWYFGAHGLKSLTQNLLLVGIAPCRTTVIGRIEAMDDRKRRKWLDDLGALGRRTA